MKAAKADSILLNSNAISSLALLHYSLPMGRRLTGSLHIAVSTSFAPLIPSLLLQARYCSLRLRRSFLSSCAAGLSSQAVENPGMRNHTSVHFILSREKNVLAHFPLHRSSPYASSLLAKLACTAFECQKHVALLALKSVLRAEVGCKSASAPLTLASPQVRAPGASQGLAIIIEADLSRKAASSLQMDDHAW